ncbi:MAG TPA: VOC family protein [Kofleriaceae bacterium]|nr:VOC family protein [Kofleriaceae bacterium]
MHGHDHGVDHVDATDHVDVTDHRRVERRCGSRVPLATVCAMTRLDYRLYLLRVFVSDFERAARFYTEKLGMKAAYRSDDWAQFTLAGADLAIERPWP